jgi:NAD(P)-dependent dehydrogenase (short-subunit alcohol dehydrogenase family)
MEMERAMGKLKNKNILITGGTRGIGLASAQEFEREGARVVICGTDEKTLKEARSTLGPKALAFRADVRKLSDLDSLYAKIKTELGHLDALSARRTRKTSMCQVASFCGSRNYLSNVAL